MLIRLSLSDPQATFILDGFDEKVWSRLFHLHVVRIQRTDAGDTRYAAHNQIGTEFTQMLILIIILILVFGFGGYRMGPGLGYYGGGGLSLILTIVLILLLLKVL